MLQCKLLYVVLIVPEQPFVVRCLVKTCVVLYPSPRILSQGWRSVQVTHAFPTVLERLDLPAFDMSKLVGGPALLQRHPGSASRPGCLMLS